MTNYQEEEECIELLPGFRFHPTDEEIITHYLLPKVANAGAFAAIAIGEVDLNKCEPWDLPSKAKMEGKKEWYFYCRRDRKYPTGTRANRATAAGFWKATGKDREIFRGRGVLVGTRKTLVFYRGRAPNGEKTNWVMHEYRLEGAAASIFSALPKSVEEEWVVCRVIQKGAGGGGEKGSSSTAPPSCLERITSFGNGFLQPPLVVDTPLSSFSNKKLEGFDDLSAVMNDNLAASSYSQLEPAQSWQYNYSGYLQQQETPFAMRRPTKNIYPTQHGPQQITSALELTGRRSTADPNTAILSAVMNDNPAASSYSQLEPAQSWQYNYSGYLQQQETPSAMRRPTKNIYPTQQGPKKIASAQELMGRRSTADHNTAISSVVSSLDFGPSGGAGTGPLLDLENVWFKTHESSLT